MPKPKLKQKILPGETWVLDALGNNIRYKQMPDAIFIAASTANTHMRNARKRNKVNNNVALFRIGVEEGNIKLKIKNRDCDETDNHSKIYFYSLMNFTP